MSDALECIVRLRHLVSLNETRNGGPYQGFAARGCMEAMTEAAWHIEMLREALTEISECTGMDRTDDPDQPAKLARRALDGLIGQLPSQAAPSTPE